MKPTGGIMSKEKEELPRLPDEGLFEDLEAVIEHWIDLGIEDLTVIGVLEKLKLMVFADNNETVSIEEEDDDGEGWKKGLE